MYQEYLPHTSLSSYIDKYWVSKGIIIGEQRLFVAADGCVDIIFSAGESARVRAVKEWHPYVVGVMNTYTEVPFRKEVDMLGIRFKPAGITAFTRTPIYELADVTADLNHIDSLFDEELYLPLQENIDLKQRLEHIDEYLIKKLSKAYFLEERVVHAVDRIFSCNGLASTKRIADDICLSPRQLERVFKSSIGISPKTFSRIARFMHTKQYIKRNPDISLFDVAIDCGYYDHSHLFKEFAALSGYLPK